MEWLLESVLWSEIIIVKNREEKMKWLANNQAIQRNMLYRLFLYGKILLFTVQKVEKVKGI